MSHQVDIDDSRKLIIVTGSGDINFEAIISLCDTLLSEPCLSLPYGIAIDYREADLMPIDNAHLAHVAATLDRQRDKVLAINLSLLVGGPLEYGISRMFQALTSSLPFEVLVTQDEEAAFDWAQATNVADPGKSGP